MGLRSTVGLIDDGFLRLASALRAENKFKQ